MDFETEEINAVVLKSTAEYLKEYGEDHGLSVGEVINRMLFQLDTDNSSDIAIDILGYMESLTSHQTFEQKKKSVIVSIAYLLTTVTDYDFTLSDALRSIADTYHIVSPFSE